MDTAQIHRILRHLPNFQGVYSADMLPKNPHLLVCNTDESKKPGTHWVAIYINESGIGEFFDSFGRPPDARFERYMNVNCRRWIFNNKQLQSLISTFCGYYCCVFVLLRSRNYDMRKIIAMFTNDTGFNDWLVHRFICK